MNFIVRTANLKDAAAIAELHVQTWKTLYGGLIDQNYLDSMNAAERLETWKSNLKKTGKNYTVFVAELDSKIAGFTTLGFADEDQPDLAEMYSIYLDPAAHGQGIGSALFSHALNWAKNFQCRKLTAWVFKAYIPGHEFYKYKGGRLISSSEKNLIIDGTSYPIVSYVWTM